MDKWGIALFYSLVIILLTGCRLTANAVADLEVTEPLNISVYFCPRDDCSGHLVEALSSAQKRIHCAFYDLDLENVKSALAQMSAKVDVLVVMDNDNAIKWDKNVLVRRDDSGKLMHNKFCVIDDEYVWTGSFNPTFRCDKLNNNNALLVKSRYLNQNYETEFKEMWYGTFGDGNPVKYPKVSYIENYFCPDDGCADHVIETLSHAEHNISFMTFSFTDDDIGKILVQKFQEGIAVSGVFETTQKNDYTEYDRLINAGIPVKWDQNPANMHHKVFIVDDKIVITGSYNPTSNGNKNNDENILIIDNADIAKKYADEFSMVYPQN
jgi:phosphatidylserine/phosphatidylglycerophosphate/cardiolipin synthase-like enzyme